MRDVSMPVLTARRLAGPVAVTGPGGFIGGAVCRAVLASGGRVVGLGPGEVARHPGLRHVPRIIDDADRLAEDLQGVDTLIHAAGRGTPAAVDRLDGEVARTEIQLTAQVLEAALRAGVRKVVVVSSGGTIYGDTSALAAVGEQRPMQPISRYGAVKAMIEQMALSMARAGLLDCVVARVSNPYGPGQLNLRGQGLVATLIEQMLRGRTIPVWGDGSTCGTTYTSTMRRAAWWRRPACPPARSATSRQGWAARSTR